MSREEAINVLNDYDINFERHTAEEVAEAHEMAIEALEEQPSKRTEERTETRACDCISRKAAINALWKALHEYEDKTEKQFLESKELDVADWFQHRIFVQNMSDIDRQTILNLPSVNSQPNEDCISRKAVLDALHRYFAEGFNEDRWWNSTYVLGAINEVPSVTPQPKTGRWILSGGYWRCSECKEKALLKLDKATGGCREYEPVRSKYCPECGVKMQEVQK